MHKIFRRGARPCALTFIVLMMIPQFADARIYIRIDEVSDRKFTIALPALINAGDKRDREDWARQIPRIIKNDLRLTDLFEFVEPELFPLDDVEAYSEGDVNFQGWRLLGIQGVVKGAFRYEGKKVTAELFLYDPILGIRLVHQNYEANKNDYATIAHHFADQIMETLTGFRGIFRTRLAFVSGVSGAKEIYAMGIDGSGVRRLTKDRSISLSPAWSPDGRHIAYTRYTEEGYPEINLLDVFRKKSKQITNNKTIALGPEWTPNGKELTVTIGDGDAEIYTVSTSGKRQRRLTHQWGIDLGASWSPGGGAFVFASERAGGLHLFRAAADGSNVQRLTFVGYQNDQPSWSPDGEKIVFQGRDEGVWDLFIMNADGSNIQRLTRGAGNNENPTWAPNSRYIAFSSSRTGNYQIYVMNINGGTAIHVPTAGSSTQPDWGPYVD